ncbi:hypothetical protein HU200_049967 [Digitaria exilis]|uniref:Uncharacterized protein n=1 Tax=Digitaria exilis TaxID=1010633 RepID=A0A835APD1_9POAL|nr:hypothetical protein HU200_049967 [Digitaria exilis]
MGRPPCCDKVGIKKGPWTPEEDIILVSYIQEHGPGNWRSVPINTGLMRCSKSCRLRWTNYLRPGIRRGNFTPPRGRHHQDGQRHQNYWNTHLKKKLKKHQAIGAIFAPPPPASESSSIIQQPPPRSPAMSANTTMRLPQLIARRSPFAATIDGDSSSSPYAPAWTTLSKFSTALKSSSPQNGATRHQALATEINPLLSFNHMSSSTKPSPVFSDILPVATAAAPADIDEDNRSYSRENRVKQHTPAGSTVSDEQVAVREEATEQSLPTMDCPTTAAARFQ